MSNTYRINFKQLRQENLKNTFIALDEAMEHLGIDFYLVGALARDTWFAQNGIRALGTKDIDFAVLISDTEKFEELKAYLVSNKGFIASSGNDYVVFDQKGFQIDLLPFGMLEIEGKKIVDSKGLIHSNVTGFREVYDAATELVEFDGTHSFSVSSLPGIVLLKLIAYDDRPEMRSQDIKDIAQVIEHYSGIEMETIMEEHADLFETTDDLRMIGARLIGRQLQPVLAKNKLLEKRIHDILTANTQSATSSPMGRLMLYVNDQPVEYQVKLIEQILHGLSDK